MDAMLFCTMSAAVEHAFCFHTVPNHPASTMRAGRGQSVDRAFEAIENMGHAAHPDFKAFVVDVAAYFTSHPRDCVSFNHCLPLSLTGFSPGLRLLDVLASRAGLRGRGFGALRDVPARLGFETVAADPNGPGA
jgi:hypothetical protein